MAPSADTDVADTAPRTASGNRLKAPLKLTGALDHYDQFDVTNVIGREFPTLQLADILDDDAQVRDLAVLVAQRGVVFFRRQTTLTVDGQKRLGQKLGELTGKPLSSKLHKHALSNSKRGIAVDEHGRLDDEVSVISSVQQRKFYRSDSKKERREAGWHADITFENIPSDYAILKITETPEDAGGDTLWASGYELYDRLSPSLQKLAEGLTATHYQPAFVQIKDKFDVDLLETDRGSPENNGLDFQAEHPVVRTNPVTGWKSLFAAGHQVDAGWINGVTARESDILKTYFLQLITENHDLQVRFRWNKDDVAIWDNRSVFHTATADYAGTRQGNRVVSLGERPYFDAASTSRREALAVDV